jgi:hypothetical protein
MNSRLKRLTPVLIPAAVAIGVCYSFGYWDHFGIDALQYVSLVDVAKLSVYPLFVLVGISIVGMLFSYFGTSRVFPPGGGAESAIGRGGRKHGELLVFINVVVLGLVLLVGVDPWKWYVAATLAALFSAPLSHVPSLIDLFPSPRLRAIMISQLLALPFLALAVGSFAANRAEQGTSQLHLDTTRSALTVESDSLNPAVYLGKLGDHIFIYETLNRAVIVLGSDVEQPLVLVQPDG